MKHLKRYACILITLLILASVPSAALAAVEYAPTEAVCTHYVKQGDQWVQEGDAVTRQWSYKKDGRLTKTTSISASGNRSVISISWKGDLVTKVKYGNDSITSYAYKKGLLKQVAHSVNGSQSATSYTIKKNKSIYATDGQTTTITYTKKKQYKKVTIRFKNGSMTRTYLYYPDGNLKKYTATDPSGITSVARFTKKGYLKSYTTTSPWGTDSSTYSYKSKNGKLRECIVTYKGGSSESQQRFVYKNWKKVSRIRNCDGHESIWGIGVLSEFDGRG